MSDPVESSVDAAQPVEAAPSKRPAPPSALMMRLGTIGQIMRMLERNKRWWLAPMMIILTLLGLVLSGLTAIEYIAPFIYAIF